MWLYIPLKLIYAAKEIEMSIMEIPDNFSFPYTIEIYENSVLKETFQLNEYSFEWNINYKLKTRNSYQVEIFAKVFDANNNYISESSENILRTYVYYLTFARLISMMGCRMSLALLSRGVDVDKNDGLTTLVDKIKDIENYSFKFACSYVKPGNIILKPTLKNQTYPINNATITLIDESNNTSTCTTNNDGVGTKSITINDDTIYTATYNDISITRDIEYLFNFYNLNNWHDMAHLSYDSSYNALNVGAVTNTCLNTPFTNDNYYTLKIYPYCPKDNRLGLRFFSNPDKPDIQTGYTIYTDIRNTQIVLKDDNGNQISSIDAGKNYFSSGEHDIELIRDNNIATLTFDGDILLDNIDVTGLSNTIGVWCWQDNYIGLRGISLDSYIFRDAANANKLSHYGNIIPVESNYTGANITYDTTMNAYKLQSTGNGIKVYPINALDGITQLKLSADIYLPSTSNVSTSISLEAIADSGLTNSCVGWCFENDTDKLIRHRFKNKTWQSNDSVYNGIYEDEWCHFEMIVNNTNVTVNISRENQSLIANNTYTLSNTSTMFNTPNYRKYGIGIGWANGAVGYVKNIKAQYL